jgi:eukaryotic-like serine/threonine-protein kinase
MKAIRVLTIFILMMQVSVNILSANNVLTEWKFRTGGTIVATPLIDDTVLYFGSTDKVFYAISTRNGSEIWHYTAAYEINSKAVTNDSLVIFESGFKLYALDKKTGALKWSFVANSALPAMSLGFTDYHHSSPVIYNDKVYYGDGWGNLNGVDIKTGVLKFQYTIKTDSSAIRSTPALLNDVAYFGDWGGRVYAVSVIDSALIWKYTLANRREYYGMVTSDMVINDTLLYFGSQHDVFSPLDIKTGQPAWTFVDPNQTYLPSTPVFYKNSVIIGSTVLTYKIYCLVDGTVKWSHPSDGIFFVHPVMVDSVVIMNTSSFGNDGTVFILNANNGDLMNDYHFRNASPASPAIGDNKIFIGNGDGYLYAFNLLNLIYPKDDSSVVMDTVTQDIELHQNDAKLIRTFTIENKGFASDSFSLTPVIVGDNSQQGIGVTSENLTSIWVNQVKYGAISIKPSLLAVGKYSINYSLTSVRHPEVVLKKTFHINILEATALETNRAENFLKVYPNPAKNLVNFEFICSTSTPIKINIYSMNGILVHTLLDSAMKGKLTWNTEDNSGRICSPGVYVYQIITDRIINSGSFSIMGQL